jgi:hypothetical protein
MKKPLAVLAMVILAVSLLCGCADTKATGAAVSVAALTAPALAHPLEIVYAALIAAQAVPDHRAEATKALASLDAIAPMVQAQGAALAGDEFNWASFVIQAAITAAQVMGVWS